MRLWIPRYTLYTDPDVMVVMGSPIYERDNKTTLTNPTIIVEVLSKSTQDYDQSGKFRMYRSIPDFKEYILINQYQPYAEQYVKNEAGKWVLTEYEPPEDTLVFASVDFQISFADLYESVIFEE